jgi:hypothetical protein
MKFREKSLLFVNNCTLKQDLPQIGETREFMWIFDCEFTAPEIMNIFSITDWKPKEFIFGTCSQIVEELKQRIFFEIFLLLDTKLLSLWSL